VTDPARAALAAGWAGFGAADAGTRVEPLGAGHINDTYLVTRGTARHVLQRVSDAAFPDPARVSANTERLVAFLAATDVRVPELMSCRTTGCAYVDASGSHWRLWRFIEGRTLDAPVSEAEARAAGAAFGELQRAMERFPPPPLKPAIPGFLELGRYLDALARERRRPARADGVVESALAFIDARRELARRFPPRGDYVHGDCKIDNLLFEPRAPVVRCVLDLDTVMPGNWGWDYGDLARSLLTLADGAASGERCALVVAAARGMLEGRGSAARSCPLRWLLEAPRYVALMLGVRFLTDHLKGDVYFKVVRPGENLDRAHRQFALVSELETHEPALARRLSEVPGVLA